MDINMDNNADSIVKCEPESESQQYGHLTQFLKVLNESVTDEGRKRKTTIEMPCALGEVKSEHEEYYDDSLTPAEQPATYTNTNTTVDADQDRPSTSAPVISRPASVGSVHSDRTEAGILTPNSSPAVEEVDDVAVDEEREKVNFLDNANPSPGLQPNELEMEVIFEPPKKYIRMPVKGFSIWARDHPRYADSAKSTNFSERAQIRTQLASEWRAMSPKEREPWENRAKAKTEDYRKHNESLYGRERNVSENPPSTNDGSNGTADKSRRLVRVLPFRAQPQTTVFRPPSAIANANVISPAQPTAIASSSLNRRVIRILRNPDSSLSPSSSTSSAGKPNDANDDDEQEIEIVGEKVSQPKVARVQKDPLPVVPNRNEEEGPIELGEWIARIADDLQLRMVRSGKNLILSPPKMSNSTRSLLIISFEPTYLILNEFLGDRLQASHTWQMLGPLAQLECALRGKCYQIFYYSPKEGTGLREDVGDAIGSTSLPSVGQMTINNHEEERKTAFDTEKGEIAKKKRKRTSHRCWQGQECAENPEKPPHTYKELIGMAIAAQEDHRATLTDIYNFFRDNFEYFRGANTGWKNSVRHQLSLGGYFKKDGHDRVGNGHYWTFGRNFLVPKKQAGKKMMTNNSEGKEVLLVGENISEYILNLSTISL